MMGWRKWALAAAVAWALLLAGCGQEREQCAADAVAGTHAMGLWLDKYCESLLPAAQLAQGREILVGIEGYARATVGDPELPAPRSAPADILSDPDTYSRDASQARADSRGLGFWAAIGTGAIAALGLAVKVAKRFPWPGQPLAQFVDSFLPGLEAWHQRKEVDKARKALRASVQTTGKAWKILQHHSPGTAERLRIEAKRWQDSLGIRDEVKEALIQAVLEEAAATPNRHE